MRDSALALLRRLRLLRERAKCAMALAHHAAFSPGRPGRVEEEEEGFSAGDESQAEASSEAGAAERGKRKAGKNPAAPWAMRAEILDLELEELRLLSRIHLSLNTRFGWPASVRGAGSMGRLLAAVKRRLEAKQVRAGAGAGGEAGIERLPVAFVYAAGDDAALAEPNGGLFLPPSVGMGAAEVATWSQYLDAEGVVPGSDEQLILHQLSLGQEPTAAADVPPGAPRPRTAHAGTVGALGSADASAAAAVGGGARLLFSSDEEETAADEGAAEEGLGTRAGADPDEADEMLAPEDPSRSGSPLFDFCGTCLLFGFLFSRMWFGP